MLRFTAMLVLPLFAANLLAAAGDTPVGLWQARDDEGKPTGYIRITEREGTLRGTVERGLPGDTEKFCTACQDRRKNQPLLGMEILSGLRRDGGSYTGGEILDPFSGNSYRARLTLLDQGRRLEVRGYVGVSLFGRTQIWTREE